jgi:cytochrome oxidase Cu insertion factor (SCO1/SenC/PrrC family)
VNILRVACLVLLAGALTGGLASGDSDSPAKVGDVLTDFTLKGIDGKEVSLKQFRGKKPVLLVFGASW